MTSHIAPDPVVTLLHHTTYIGKKFEKKDGQLIKTPAAQFYSGMARVVDVPTAASFAAVLTNPDPNEVLCLGRPKCGLATAHVVTQSQVSPGKIARTLEYFEYPSAPGWLLLDFDLKGMPEPVATRIECLGGGLAALEELWPELRHAARVFKPSSSAGVYIEGHNPLKARGFHLFVLVRDVARSAALLRRLEQRAWEIGLAWHMLATNGARLSRSIVDVQVGSPERIVFIAPPQLGIGVFRSPAAINWQEGEAIGFPDHGDPNIADQNRANDYAALAAMAEEIAAKHKVTCAERVMSKLGGSFDDALRIVESRLNGRILQDDDIIPGPGGKSIRVGDLLDRKPKRLSLPDPNEGYDYNPTAATFLWGSNFDEPRLVSHAHGLKVVYRFARFGSVPETEEVQSASLYQPIILPPPAELQDGRAKTLEDALLGCRDTEDQQVRLAVVLAVAIRLGRQVPTQRSLDGLQSYIEEALPKGLLSDQELNAIIRRVDRQVSDRKIRALKHVSLPLKAKVDHDYQEVEALSALPQEKIHGVIAIRSPMGSGKTQNVGQPLVEQAKLKGKSVVAISPRISLCAEQSKRLGLLNYQTVRPEDLVKGTGLSICLPSITKPAFADYLDQPAVVFIDEGAQVMRFFAAKNYCRTAEAEPDDVLEKLGQIVRRAEVVLVADAGLDARTLGFLQHYRPNERFQIIEMRNSGLKKDAHFIAGSSDQVRERVAQEVLRELASGGKVWLATEGQELAETFGEYFSLHNFKTIVITGPNKTGREQARFMRDADRLSREYDVVIASPAISGGISVEHRDGPHFTLVAYVGGGYTTTPADAVQQLGRVRYVSRYLIGVEQTNFSGGQTWQAEVSGRSQAALLEGAPVRPMAYDGLIADITSENSNARADFGGGLWWQLQAEGWAVRRDIGPDGQVTSGLSVTDIAKQRKEAYRKAVMASDLISDETASMLKDLERTEEIEIKLEGWSIRKAVGKLNIDDEDLNLWDDGRLVDRMERFEDLTQFVVERPDDSAVTLAHRGLRKARCDLYRRLFDGIEIYQNNWCTADIAEVIVDRVMEAVDLYAAVGIIPQKYRARFEGKNGRHKMAARPKKAMKLVEELMEQAGLKLRKNRVRLSQKTSPEYNTGEFLGQDDNRAYAGSICQTALETMNRTLGRRMGFDLNTEIQVLNETETPNEFSW